ncbi:MULTISPECIES: DeoR/GlpR family DNA-binding transcription regulator [Streptomyces]|uniref:Lactose phosphotransferase system repressor n=2 Tax=Streptomyces TaxID=1883 RepID=A0A646KD01_STRJU|nr:MULTISPECIES: DeoR/GlpR family DNA-binding transcription regulator [Streptomyces]MQS37549.1 DeoR/GlpR transcriptional regulator [Streptomyces katsurahamanus]MQT00105.1 DeoR/GlpR transcriptional regulator [Streptomyces jumonjinensis]
MLPAERHRRISALVDRVGTISTEDLAERLSVSAETVRRDLAQMERRGVLRRVRGGAASLAVVEGIGGEEAPYADRSESQIQAKTAIGAAAAALVRPGMTVVIDVGTTAVEIARALPLDFRGTVATPSLLVAGVVSALPHASVLLPGGRLRGGDLVLSGPQTSEFFSGLYADLAFIGSGGVDASAGVTDFHFEEISAKKLMLANSALAYVVADGSKWGRVAAHRVCAVDACTGVITDASAAAEPVAAARERGCEVLVA